MKSKLLIGILFSLLALPRGFAKVDEKPMNCLTVFGNLVPLKPILKRAKVEDKKLLLDAIKKLQSRVKSSPHGASVRHFIVHDVLTLRSRKHGGDENPMIDIYLSE